MTMNASISAAVGRACDNRSGDVVMVQKLLLARGFAALGQADGDCGEHTIAAIFDFQSGFLRNPDGRVDPNGNTWRHLAASYTGAGATLPPADAPLTRPVPRPAAGSINLGLSAVNPDYMTAKFGQPMAGDYSSLCQMPTHATLRRNLVTDSVGPFRVTGLGPAVRSLRVVMSEIASAQPEVYREVGSAGMLCCRWVRGSTQAVSNHSWGTAIDLTLSGVLDAYGDDTVQYGLTLIAPIFNRLGWYWGAAFRKEDGMHFEGGRALVDQWAGELI